MPPMENSDTRYFIEIDLNTLEVIRCGFDQKQYLNKGRQTVEGVYRLFLTKGQYNKFVNSCRGELGSVLDK